MSSGEFSEDLVLRSNALQQSYSAMPSELSLVAFRDDIQFSFLFDNFVWSSYGSPWLQMSAGGKFDALSLEACRAFSLSIFGRHHHQADIEVSGALHYHKTVRVLSSRLSNVGTLITKSRTFLEQAEWLSEPWLLCDEINKNAQNRLVDILVHIPGFLEDQAQLEQVPSEHFRLDLIQRIEYQIAKTHNWRWRWEEMNPDVAWEVEPEMLPDQQGLSQHRPIRKVLLFSSFSNATELRLYNAILLFLLGLLWTLKPPVDNSPEPIRLSQCSLYLPGDAESLVEPAIDICRAFEYQLLTVKQSRDSALFWLFPLGMASKALEDKYGIFGLDQGHARRISGDRRVRHRWQYVWLWVLQVSENQKEEITRATPCSTTI